VNKAVLNMDVKISPGDPSFNSFDKYLKVELLVIMTTYEIVWELSRCFLYWLHYFTRQSTVHKGYNFSTSSSLLAIFCFVDSDDSSG
jgi:hypothetical protein